MAINTSLDNSDWFNAHQSSILKYHHHPLYNDQYHHHYHHGNDSVYPHSYNNDNSFRLNNATDYDYLTSTDLQRGQEGPHFLHPMWRGMDPLERSISATIGVVMTLVGITGAVGNFTVICLLFKCKKLQTSANMYVFNLASADLLMCLGNFPLLILSCFAQDWVTGYTSCKIYAFIGGLAGFVSINTLTAMACDRYNVIYRHKGLLKTGSRRHSFGLLVSVWIYSVFWSAPPFFGWGHFQLDGGRVSCCFDYLTRSTSNVSYIIAMFVFNFGIQVIVILFSYVNVVLAVCQHEQSIVKANMHVSRHNNHHHFYCAHLDTSHTASNDNVPPNTTTTLLAPPSANGGEERVTRKQKRAKKRRVELQVTRLVIFITLSFFFAWMPFAVVSLIGAFGDAHLVTPLVSVLPGVFAKISTVINPVLYAIGHPQYRNIILRTLRGTRTCQDGEASRRTKGTNAHRLGFLSSMYFASVMRESEQGAGTTVHLTDSRQCDATQV